MNPRPSPAHVWCKGCQQWQHRQLFLQKMGDDPTQYDILCTTCQKRRLSLPRYRLEELVSLGTISEDVKNKIVAERKARQAKNGTKQLTAHHQRTNAATWESAILSAKRAATVLRWATYNNADEEAWGVEAAEMVRAALREIHLRKKKEALPPGNRSMWYDVIENGAARLHALIKRYPSGTGNCPLQLF